MRDAFFSLLLKTATPHFWILIFFIAEQILLHNMAWSWCNESKYIKLNIRQLFYKMQVFHPNIILFETTSTYVSKYFLCIDQYQT